MAINFAYKIDELQDDDNSISESLSNSMKKFNISKKNEEFVKL